MSEFYATDKRIFKKIQNVDSLQYLIMLLQHKALATQRLRVLFKDTRSYTFNGPVVLSAGLLFASKFPFHVKFMYVNLRRGHLNRRTGADT